MAALLASLLRAGDRPATERMVIEAMSRLETPAGEPIARRRTRWSSTACRQRPEGARAPVPDVRHHLHRPREREHGAPCSARTAALEYPGRPRVLRLAYRVPGLPDIGGWVGDRYGARLALTVRRLIWSVGTLFSGFTSSAGRHARRARGCSGFGEGATFPVATRAMSDWTPAAKRGLPRASRIRRRGSGTR